MTSETELIVAAIRRASLALLSLVAAVCAIVALAGCSNNQQRAVERQADQSIHRSLAEADRLAPAVVHGVVHLSAQAQARLSRCMQQSTRARAHCLDAALPTPARHAADHTGATIRRCSALTGKPRAACFKRAIKHMNASASSAAKPTAAQRARMDAQRARLQRCLRRAKHTKGRNAAIRRCLLAQPGRLAGHAQ